MKTMQSSRATHKMSSKRKRSQNWQRTNDIELCSQRVFNGSSALTRCVISSSLILIALKTKYSQQKRRTTAAELNKRLTKWAIVKPTSPSIWEHFPFHFFFRLLPLIARGCTDVCQLFRWHRSACDSSHPGTNEVKPSNSLNVLCDARDTFDAGFSFTAGWVIWRF